MLTTLNKLSEFIWKFTDYHSSQKFYLEKIKNGTDTRHKKAGVQIQLRSPAPNHKLFLYKFVRSLQPFRHHKVKKFLSFKNKWLYQQFISKIQNH